MAWLISQNPHALPNWPHIRAKPKITSWEECAAYRDKHGFIPDGINAGGYEIEDRFWPVSGQFEGEIECIPPLLGANSFYLVPERWRDVIEEFEPGIHQFKHIPLTLKDGSLLEERFYAMNIRQALTDVADRERSTAPVKEFVNRPNRPYVFANTADRPTVKVYFRKEKVSGYHLWCPREILIYHVAMSNELFARIAQMGGMDLLDTLQIEEV